MLRVNVRKMEALTVTTETVMLIGTGIKNLARWAHYVNEINIKIFLSWQTFCFRGDCLSLESSCILVNMVFTRGPGSSVGIATDYGLDGLGSNPSGDEIFRPSRPALGATQPPVKWVLGLSQGYSTAGACC